jgi:hypothetical protein
MENKEYLVTWKIDITGENPIQAAIEALETMRDEHSEAVFFHVTDKSTQETVEIDLLEYEKQCCTCESFFYEPTENNECPKCGSGNWVEGCIDEPTKCCPVCNSNDTGTPKGKKVDFDRNCALWECKQCGAVDDIDEFKRK